MMINANDKMCRRLAAGQPRNGTSADSAYVALRRCAKQVPVSVINWYSGRGGSDAVFGSGWVTTPACLPPALSVRISAISISKNREAPTLASRSR